MGLVLDVVGRNGANRFLLRGVFSHQTPTPLMITDVIITDRCELNSLSLVAKAYEKTPHPPFCSPLPPVMLAMTRGDGMAWGLSIALPGQGYPYNLPCKYRTYVLLYSSRKTIASWHINNE